MSNVSLSLERPTALLDGAAALARQAEALAVITTPAEASAAGQFLRGVRARIRNIKAHYKRVRQPVNAALKDLKAMEADDLAPWTDADARLSAPILAWVVSEQERVKAENAERLRLAEEQAAQRKQDSVAQLTRAAEAAPTATSAAQLRRQARQVGRAPVTIVAPPPVEAEKIEGVSVPKVWRAEVTDFEELVRAVADGKAPLAALLPNAEFLDTQAVNLGNELRYPGVLAVQRPHLSARGR